MKLEFKHFVPYLPYGLKLIDNGNIVELSILNLQIIFDYPLIRTDHVKPIFHPLSDLTKEIEHNGEKFVPFEKCGGILNGNDGEPKHITHLFNCSLGKVEPRFLQHWIYENLISWHFDVFGLIEQRLAIDINHISKKSAK